MSTTPEVKLPVYDYRTNKTTEVKLKLDVIESFLVEQRTRQENTEVVKEFFESVDGPLPDLMVVYKGRQVILPTVLEKNDSAVLRLLHEATQSDIFPKPTPKKRAKNGKSTSNSTYDLGSSDG